MKVDDPNVCPIHKKECKTVIIDGQEKRLCIDCVELLFDPSAALRVCQSRDAVA